MVAPIHSPNKIFHVTAHIKDASDGAEWTALVAQPQRSLLIIQNKGNGRIGIGFGTKETAELFELRGNSTWEFPQGNVPIEFIYLKNLDTTANPIMRVVVASDRDEVEDYV